jgi:hypothetical protein
MRSLALATALALAGAAAPARADGEADRRLERDAAAEAREAAAAGLAVPAATREAVADLERRRAERPPRWGLLLDGGFPAGLAASVVFRPVPEVRFWAGPAWNVAAFGVQAGVTLVPFHVGISPTLSLEGGRYFQADATFLARRSSGVPQELEPLLAETGYDYAAAHVGIEVGTRDAFALSIRAGLAYVSLQARGTATTTAGSGGSSATIAFTDPAIRGTVPSVKLGVQLWF